MLKLRNIVLDVDAHMMPAIYCISEILDRGNNILEKI